MSGGRGRIIRFGPRRDAHARAEELLPWYVTRRLDPTERLEVESHLATCAACRAELAFQQRLQGQVADLPIDADAGWARLRPRLERGDRPWPAQMGGLALATTPWLGWAAAATLLVAVVIQPMLAAPYRGLSAPDRAPKGDAVVMFRPQTTEAEFRRALEASGARLVDGPTATGGYVLNLPAERRDAALAALRRSPGVTLAEPLTAAP